MSVKAKGWRRIICLLTNHLDQFSLTETGERNTNMKTLNSRGNGNTVINVSVRVVIRNLGCTFDVREEGVPSALAECCASF